MMWWENRFLKVKKDSLFLGEKAAAELAEVHGTPLFVYCKEQIQNNYRKMLRVMQSRTHREPRICYALKANSHPEVLRTLFDEGAWIDAVSPGEVVMARNAGFPAGKILFTGTSLSLEDIRKVICQKDVLLNIDAAPQLEMIQEARDRWFKNRSIRMAVRMNPGVGKGFNPKTTTGGVTALDGTPIKFGIQKDQVLSVFKKASEMGITPVGLHQHIGSGWDCQDMALAKQAVDIQITVASELQSQGFLLEFLDFGGGFKQRFSVEQEEFPMQDYLAYIDQKIAEARLNIKAIAFEPGQSIVGNAGVLLLRVEYIKKVYGNLFACVNSGTLTSVPRPAIYPNAYHQIVHCSRVSSPQLQILSVAGNLCETGDLFGKNIPLPMPQRGDTLAVLNAGAYCRSMASSYNMRDFPQEIVL